MKNTLKHGLHIAIVTSPEAGYGGSLLAWETYQVCKTKGIPSIIATYDRYRLYPPDIGSDLRRLPMPVDTTAGEIEAEALTCLIPIVEEARREGKFLIIDTKAGFTPEDKMFEMMTRAGLADADSAAALVAVRHGVETFWEPFEAIGIPMSRALFRYWGFRSNASEIPSDETIHRWKPRFLNRESLDDINQGPTPAIPLGFQEEFRSMIPFFGVGSHTQDVVDHIKDATEHIHSALLEPITESVQEIYFLDFPEF